MTPAELAAARALIAYSDQRDRETAARLAFGAEQYAAGVAAGDEAAARRVHDWYGAERRELAEALGTALAPRPGRAPGVLGRWHVCCKPCRLGGHRDGCSRCEDRDRAAFSDPHPDDYPGGRAAALTVAA